MTNQEIIREIERVKQDYLRRVGMLTLEYKHFAQRIIDEAQIREITKDIK